MKIAIAQTKPVRGDVRSNIKQHESLVNEALNESIDLIVFPELSLTGYEQELANELAITPSDGRLIIFQQMSNKSNLVIIVGAPIRDGSNIYIGSLIFKPHLPPHIYKKQFLHPDELVCFDEGKNTKFIIHEDPPIALSICYEISIDEHIKRSVDEKGEIYLASVAKTEMGVKEASIRLSSIAKDYSIPVFMANCCGPSSEGLCFGSSAIWNESGNLVAQLDNENPGIIVYDTISEDFTTKIHSIDPTI